jgi:hypothetical protein
MKTEEDDLLVYDEDDAVKYIMKSLPEEAKSTIDESMVEYVLDVIYEYYDENGLIDEDTTEEASIDEEDMLKYILKCSRKDKMNLSDEQIMMILEGEFNYGQSLGIYD